MISAFYRSKIHSTEDILTSCVFDAIRYSGENTLLIDWLRKTETPDGGFPLSNISHDSRIEIKFWPSLHENGCSYCQPDVMIEIEDQSKRFVLIEAKFKSGKSSHETESEIPTDQLAKEWDNLVRYSEDNGAAPVLVYLTASIRLPSKEIHESAKEINHKRNGMNCIIGWLSWRHLMPLLEGSKNMMLRDLHRLLTKLDLVIFNGISLPDDSKLPTWRFEV